MYKESIAKSLGVFKRKVLFGVKKAYNTYSSRAYNHLRCGKFHYGINEQKKGHALPSISERLGFRFSVFNSVDSSSLFIPSFCDFKGYDVVGFLSNVFLIFETNSFTINVSSSEMKNIFGFHTFQSTMKIYGASTFKYISLE